MIVDYDQILTTLSQLDTQIVPKKKKNKKKQIVQNKCLRF